ncbi:MAG: hypothetical protein DMF48_01270, partial [Verrucomicrobia bacterium]
MLSCRGARAPRVLAIFSKSAGLHKRPGLFREARKVVKNEDGARYRRPTIVAQNEINSALSTISVVKFMARMQLTADFFQQTAKVFTVSELTRSIRGTLETKFAAVWVQGEISNYKLHPSGHQYFTLKDRRAQISCVIWRDTMLPRQPLADGAQVQVYGTVTVFEARGQYQLNVQI